MLKDVNELPVLLALSPLIQSLNDKAPKNKINPEYQQFVLCHQRRLISIHFGRKSTQINFFICLIGYEITTGGIFRARRGRSSYLELMPGNRACVGPSALWGFMAIVVLPLVLCACCFLPL